MFKKSLSDELWNDIEQSVQAVLRKTGIVDVSLLSERIRRRNETENVALEDVEAGVMRSAQMRSAAMEFSNSRAQLAS